MTGLIEWIGKGIDYLLGPPQLGDVEQQPQPGPQHDSPGHNEQRTEGQRELLKESYMKERYRAKQKQREPALNLAREARKTLRTDHFHELTTLVAQFSIDLATKRDHPQHKRHLSPEQLVKVQALERVFCPRDFSKDDLNVEDPHAIYNPLATLGVPNYAHPDLHNQNISWLFSSQKIAGYYGTAIACLEELQQAVQRRDFSGLNRFMSLGQSFFYHAAKGCELPSAVGLEINEPAGPDVLVQSFNAITKKHPFGAYVGDIIGRVVQAKEMAVQAFDPKYRNAFMLEVDNERTEVVSRR